MTFYLVDYNNRYRFLFSTLSIYLTTITFDDDLYMSSYYTSWS